MTRFVKWSESGHLARAVAAAGGEEEFLRGVRQMLDEARAWRLAEMRLERGYTQSQVAERMGVTKGRISQIESGQVSGQDVIARYVGALGGNLVVVAVFGDGELRKVG
jgi:DNA-binding XRE family transcriptional regulator